MNREGERGHAVKGEVINHFSPGRSEKIEIPCFAPPANQSRGCNDPSKLQLSGGRHLDFNVIDLNIPKTSLYPGMVDAIAPVRRLQIVSVKPAIPWLGG